MNMCSNLWVSGCREVVSHVLSAGEETEITFFPLSFLKCHHSLHNCFKVPYYLHFGASSLFLFYFQVAKGKM